VQQDLPNDDNHATSARSLLRVEKTAEMSKLCEMLAAANSPAFAIVDGAKYDDLPNALIRARFVSRPLYSDRGGQVKDFDHTSPQFVYLDRTRDTDASAKDEPCNEQIVRSLFDLIEDCSAAVFWSCRQGGETLFRHLRKINRVQIEAGHLPSSGELPTANFKDDILLFRHADANVMAQVLPALTPELLKRLIGPAEAISFVPDIVWTLEDEYVFQSPQSISGMQTAGMIRFDSAVMKRIEARRAVGVLRHLLLTFSSYRERMGDDYKRLVAAAHKRATHYGIETLEDLELFTLTECEYGPKFEFRSGHEEAHYMLAQSGKSPAERVYYARRACLEAHQNE
jgi:hypothetical protein